MATKQEALAKELGESLREMLGKEFVELEAGAFDRVGKDVAALRAVAEMAQSCQDYEQQAEYSDHFPENLGALLEVIADDVARRLDVHHEDMMALLDRISKVAEPAEQQAA